MSKHLILMAVAAMLIAACGQATPEPTAEPTPTVPPGGPVSDYATLVDGLRQAGLTAAEAGEISQPFFTVEGQILEVDGEQVQVFEFADATAAAEAATLVSEDGSAVGTSQVDWVGTPHFFSIGRLIVIYVGDNETVLSALAEALGPQFAGG